MDKQTLIDSWAQNTAASQACTPAQMNARIARWGDIPASPRAFVDTWIDGHQRTLYSVIGSGVTDDPNFKPRIAAAENFHVDYIVAPKGCGAAETSRLRRRPTRPSRSIIRTAGAGPRR